MSDIVLVQDGPVAGVAAGQIVISDESPVNAEELGSELSGMSAEIPTEVEDYCMSGSYLKEYDRECKTGVMMAINRGYSAG